MTVELIYTLGLVALFSILGLVYAIRVLLKGRAQFDRVDQQGGSALLGKSVMEMVFWGLQPIVRLLIFFRVTPNMVSAASLFLGFVAGACLAFGHFGSGAVFATFSALLDALDGIVARHSGLSSEAGEVLDASVDRYVEFFFLAGLIVYYREIPVYQILALLALLGSFMVSYSSAKAEALHVDPPKGSMRRPERAAYLIIGAALSPVTIPWLEVHRESAIFIGHPMIVALGLVAVMSNLSAVERLMAVARAVRRREELAKADQLRKGEVAGGALLADSLKDSDREDSIPRPLEIQ